MGPESDKDPVSQASSPLTRTDGAGQLLAVDGGSRAIEWQIPKGGGPGGAAAIADDGTLYVGSWEGDLYAIE